MEYFIFMFCMIMVLFHVCSPWKLRYKGAKELWLSTSLKQLFLVNHPFATCLGICSQVVKAFFRFNLCPWESARSLSNTSLLLRRFVFRIVEVRAKRELQMMNRKGPWEGYRRLAFPPSFARTSSSRERRLGTRQVKYYIRIRIVQRFFRREANVFSPLICKN